MSTLGPKDEAMAVLVAKGDPLLAAGVAQGFSRATCYRRGQDPDFRALVAEIRTRMVDEAIGTGAAALTGSMSRFVALVASKDEQVALRAGKLVIDAFVSLSNHADLVGRLEVIERQLREQGECAGEAVSH